MNHSAPPSLSKWLKLHISPKSPQSSPNHDQNIVNNLNEAPGDGLAFLNLHARTDDQPTVGQEGHVPDDDDDDDEEGHVPARAVI